MKKIFTLCAVVIFSVNVFSQVPSIQWQKLLGGSGHDYGCSVQQTFDGGFIIVGTSYSNDGDVSGHHGTTSYRDYWIVKLDSNGTLQWQKSLGGTLDDITNSIQQTADSGYIIAGMSISSDGDVTSNQGGLDYWIVKLDANGVIQWQRSLGGSMSDQACAIKQTVDGGYIVGGSSSSNDGDVSGNHGNNYDFWLIKLDGSGNTQWKQCLGGTYGERLYAIQYTSDGGYIVSGNASSYDGDVTGVQGKWDYWIVKLTNNGSIQWQKTFGGTQDDTGYSIYQTSDGGYIIGGSSNSSDGDVLDNHGLWDFWIIKIDSSANVQWKKSFGGSSSDYATSIQQTYSGDIIVAGYTMSNDGDVSGNHGVYDSWIMKLDMNGNIQWKKCYGGTSSDYANSVQQTSDGGYIIAGDSYSNDGDVSGNHGGWDYWIMKLYPDSPANINENNFLSFINLFPNPATNELTVQSSQFKVESMNVYDIIGSRLTLPFDFAQDDTRVDVSSLAPGIYFVKLRGEKEERVAKFVKQ